jgi:hypothetical protein
MFADAVRSRLSVSTPKAGCHAATLFSPKISQERANFNDPPDYRFATKGVDPSSPHFTSTIGDISG